MKGKVTNRSVDALRVGEYLADTEVRGFVARRLPSGVVTYGFRYWNRTSRRRRWIAIGLHGTITPAKAKEIATKYAGSVADRRDPIDERMEAQAAAALQVSARTVDQVLDEFLERYVELRKLRTRKEIESILRRFVRPRIGNTPIREIKRSQLTSMLDEIEEAGSSRLADKVLAQTRKAFNWWTTRDDEFNSPIVRGMARTSLRELTRKRVLSDEELRQIWLALEGFTPTVYARIVKTLMFSGARLNEVARLRWLEIEEEGWTIPASRYKSKVDHTLPTLHRVKEFLGCRANEDQAYVFSSRDGEVPFSGFSKAKLALDERINLLRKKKRLKPIEGWRLHDLRRTARSLMSRAGVAADIAERVIGHILPGIRAVYDRHDYLDEKAVALSKLQRELELVLNLPTQSSSSVEKIDGAL